MARQQRSGSFGFNGIISLVIGVAIMFGLYILLKGAMSILWFLGPVLFILAFFLNRSVVTGFFKSMFSNFKTKPVMSVAKALLTFFAFPLVGGYLFGKAVLKNKVAEVTGQMNKKPEFTEYEEVKGEAVVVEDDEDFLDISEIEEQLEDLTVKETKKTYKPPTSQQAKPDPNKYDNLFD